MGAQLTLPPRQVRPPVRCSLGCIVKIVSTYLAV